MTWPSARRALLLPHSRGYLGFDEENAMNTFNVQDLYDFFESFEDGCIIYAKEFWNKVRAHEELIRFYEVVTEDMQEADNIRYLCGSRALNLCYRDAIVVKTYIRRSSTTKEHREEHLTELAAKAGVGANVLSVLRGSHSFTQPVDDKYELVAIATEYCPKELDSSTIRQDGGSKKVRENVGVLLKQAAKNHLFHADCGMQNIMKTKMGYYVMIDWGCGLDFSGLRLRPLKDLEEAAFELMQRILYYRDSDLYEDQCNERKIDTNAAKVLIDELSCDEDTDVIRDELTLIVECTMPDPRTRIVR